jgi:hypothetical protein
MLRRVLCRHNRKPCGVFQPVRSFFLRFEIKKILFCEVMRILRSVGHHLFLKPSVNIIDLQLCMGSPILQPQRIHGGTSINTPCIIFSHLCRLLQDRGVSAIVNDSLVGMSKSDSHQSNVFTMPTFLQR